MTTVSAKAQDVHRQWFEVNAEQHVLGRLASEIAKILMGKHKPTYTKHVDTGDCVIVTCADSIQVTGGKMEKKVYHWHTGFPGGIKGRTLADTMEKDPTLVIRAAVKRMLPRNKLGRQMLKKLYVYAGAEHPHVAQHPKPWDERLALTAQAINQVNQVEE